MTVRELIQLLRTIPQDLPVVMQGPVVREVTEVDLHIRPGAGPVVKLIGEQKLITSAPGQLNKYIVLRNGKIFFSAECYNEPYPLRWFMREYGSVLQPGDEVYTKVNDHPKEILE